MGRGGFGERKTVRLSDFLTHENKHKCLKLRGLPFQAEVREIRDFFGDFRVAERDVIIDMSNGQPTGYALVFLENEEEAKRAAAALNGKNVGTRYVDVFFPDVK